MPAYSEATLDHFHNPRNAGRLEAPDAVGKAGDPEKGGPFMVLFLKLEGERITKATYQTYGCPAAIAAGSVVTERLTGSTRTEALCLDEVAINEALGVLPMEKRHCSALAAKAVANALATPREATSTESTITERTNG